MDKPRGYYAEWNKSDRERQISYKLIFVKCKTSKQKCQLIILRYREQIGGQNR